MKAQRITYQGREYKIVGGQDCDHCDLRIECDADANAVPDCGGWMDIFRETLRSRLARWLRDPTPYTDESHANTRYSTLDEVNARRPGGQS